MTGAGFSEAVTFGFIADAAAAAFAADGDVVPITNPLSETFAVLRPSPLPGLVDAVAHNRAASSATCGCSRSATLHAPGRRTAVARVRLDRRRWRTTGAAARRRRLLRHQGRRRTRVRARCAWTPRRGRPSMLVARPTAQAVADAKDVAVARATGRERRRSPRPVGGRCTSPRSISMRSIGGCRTRRRSSRCHRHPSVTRDISILVDDTLASGGNRAGLCGRRDPRRVARVRSLPGQGHPRGQSQPVAAPDVPVTRPHADRRRVQAAMDAVLSSAEGKHGRAAMTIVLTRLLTATAAIRHHLTCATPLRHHLPYSLRGPYPDGKAGSRNANWISIPSIGSKKKVLSAGIVSQTDAASRRTPERPRKTFDCARSSTPARRLAESEATSGRADALREEARPDSVARRRDARTAGSDGYIRQSLRFLRATDPP